MTATLTVDDLEFEVRTSPRRKTLQITVDRGGELIISGPQGYDLDAMQAFVHEKRFWVYTKLAEKEALRQPTASRSFVNGEGFPYLGRSHRLLLVNRQDEPLKLERGRFRLVRSEAHRGRELFIGWYASRGRRWLSARVGRFAGRLGVGNVDVEVRDLGFRWGSCGKNGTLNFHWYTLQLPASIAEYIVVHELAHLRVHDHSRAFWNLVERLLPDFAVRKQWLAQAGGAVVGL
jgi:predicted metal-dependent hydrolase